MCVIMLITSMCLLTGRHTPRLGGTIAPRAIAKRFSVEAIFEPGTKPLGFHKMYAYLPWDQALEILHTISYAIRAEAPCGSERDKRV